MPLFLHIFQNTQGTSTTGDAHAPPPYPKCHYSWPSTSQRAVLLWPRSRCRCSLPYVLFIILACHISSLQTSCVWGVTPPLPTAKYILVHIYTVYFIDTIKKNREWSNNYPVLSQGSWWQSRHTESEAYYYMSSGSCLRDFVFLLSRVYSIHSMIVQKTPFFSFDDFLSTNFAFTNSRWTGLFLLDQFFFDVRRSKWKTKKIARREGGPNPRFTPSRGSIIRRSSRPTGGGAGVVWYTVLF